MVTGAEFLKSRPECTGKIGAVGFCYGGGIVNMLAVRLPDLGAAVPFYGAQPVGGGRGENKVADADSLRGARTSASTPAGPLIETALKDNNVKYEAFTYPNVNHGFHNDTTPRYDEAAAKLAWQRTVDFFNKNLRG